ncbi:MAG TPA: hypothetical protein VHQ24_01200 [Lachnospiraceae bacterium]|nr:hypothetical protein [Lachnospiraceae bacterium]
MNKQVIDLTRFLTKGQVECDFKDSMLSVVTNLAIPTQRFDAEHLSINSYIYLPDRYRLPIRIDMTVKIDAPGLYILFGKGHINIGTLWSDNRRIDDIVAPTRKTKFYHNHIDMNAFVDISLLYDRKEMQILVNGEERYYSTKEKYMKSSICKEMNENGFELKIACDKLVNACIKSLTITEYQDSCGIVHSDEELPNPITKNQAIIPGEKPSFDQCISILPEEIQNEIIKLDEFLRSQKLLKFKRQIEKNGNKITYVASDYGFSYAIYLSNDLFDHSLQWYIITSGKPDTWHRKADMMEETLNRLSVEMPDFADRMYYSLDDCVGCYKDCLARTQYRFHGKKKSVCHGKLKFRMNTSGFEDVRAFVEEIGKLVQDSHIN